MKESVLEEEGRLLEKGNNLRSDCNRYHHLIYTMLVRNDFRRVGIFESAWRCMQLV